MPFLKDFKSEIKLLLIVAAVSAVVAAAGVLLLKTMQPAPPPVAPTPVPQTPPPPPPRTPQPQTIETFSYLASVSQIRFYDGGTVSDFDISSSESRVVLDAVAEIVGSTTGGTWADPEDVKQIKAFSKGIEIISSEPQEIGGAFDIALFGGTIDRIFLDLDTENETTYRFYFGNKEYFEGRELRSVSSGTKYFILDLALQQRQTMDASTWQTYRNDEYGFEVKYPDHTFAIVPVETAVYPDFDIPYKGDKLISVGAKDRLGKTECWYGEAGFAMECKAASEDGISFMVINQPLSYFTRFGDAGEREEEVTIGGKTGTAYSYGAEGYNTEHHYIPMTNEQTLVITVKSTFNWESKTRYPSKELVDKILATFRFTP